MREKISGIYMIFNHQSFKYYIGSSCNIFKRITTHINELSKNKHHSRVLQRAWNKYGNNSFSFSILELCKFDKTLIIEQKYLDLLNPAYNCSLKATSVMFGRKHKPSTIEKFKLRKVKKGKDHHLYGKKLSKEHVNNVIKAQTGMKRSETFKNNQRIAAIKNNQWFSLKGHIESLKKQITDSAGNTFSSLTEASKFWNISVQAICDNLKGRSKKCQNGVTFKYV